MLASLRKGSVRDWSTNRKRPGRTHEEGVSLSLLLLSFLLFPLIMASKKFAKAQEEAKKFVDQHNLERFVTQMVNGMIQSKPADPKIYMIRFIAERCPPEKLEENGIYIEGLPRSPVSPQSGKKAMSLPNDQASPAKAEDVTEAGPKAEELGARASASGSSLDRASSIAASIRADVEKVPPPAPAGGAANPPAPSSADSDTERWANVTEWEQLTHLIENENANLPPPGATATIGGVKWLASLLVGEPPSDQTLDRLKWISQRCGSYLFQVDSDGTNLAMAMSGLAGDGPWNEWLFDRGICFPSTKDAAGNSVQEWAERGSQRGSLRKSLAE